MLIQRVEIKPLCGEEQADMASGMVALTSEGTCLTVLCRVPRLLGRSAANIHARLVDEALRQVRRMPEFRHSPSRVELAPGALV
ncbi:MAG: hypothetical protein MK160_07650 [Rhodobacteraceae bacterium]|nr:hypothetical protein [Paracoccaceae bacterium]